VAVLFYTLQKSDFFAFSYHPSAAKRHFPPWIITPKNIPTHEGTYYLLK